MLNNDIMRSLRYTFQFDDDKMVELCSSSTHPVSRAEISSWLKKEDAEGYMGCNDASMTTFLDGFISYKRGAKPGTAAAEPRQPQQKLSPNTNLNNNIVFRKIRIALELKDQDILAALTSVDFSLSKSELAAFFRKPNHKNYRKCKDQVMRNFLRGLQIRYRPDSTDSD